MYLIYLLLSVLPRNIDILNHYTILYPRIINIYYTYHSHNDSIEKVI